MAKINLSELYNWKENNLVDQSLLSLGPGSEIQLALCVMVGGDDREEWGCHVALSSSLAQSEL